MSAFKLSHPGRQIILEGLLANVKSIVGQLENMKRNTKDIALIHGHDGVHNTVGCLGYAPVPFKDHKHTCTLAVFCDSKDSKKRERPTTLISTFPIPPHVGVACVTLGLSLECQTIFVIGSHITVDCKLKFMLEFHRGKEWRRAVLVYNNIPKILSMDRGDACIRFKEAIEEWRGSVDAEFEMPMDMSRILVLTGHEVV